MSARSLAAARGEADRPPPSAPSLAAILHGEALAAAIEAMLDRLDAEEDTDADGDVDDLDCCEAGDDDPASPIPARGACGLWGGGDPSDAEEDDPPGCEHDGREPDVDAEPNFIARNGIPDLETLGAAFVTGPAECGEVRL